MLPPYYVLLVQYIIYIHTTAHIYAWFFHLKLFRFFLQIDAQHNITQLYKAFHIL